MNILQELAFRIDEIEIPPGHVCFRPPTWPPRADWIVSLTANGLPLSRWDSDFWDFSAWAGYPFKIKFKPKSSDRIGPMGERNLHLLRLAASWMIWGPRGIRKWNTLKTNFGMIRRLVLQCDKEGVYAGDLMRFPRVLDRIARVVAKGETRLVFIGQLDNLLQAREALGFCIVDEDGLARIAAISLENDRETEQTAYIPPRIWVYQVRRLRECLVDFSDHADAIRSCFDFCLEAYTNSFGSLDAAFTTDENLRRHRLPFSLSTKGTDPHPGYIEPFIETAARFGLLDILQKWIGSEQQVTIKMLASYFTLVQFAGMAYIASFTLQRAEEVNSLRYDCLRWDEDEILGRIPLIFGESTKTEEDSDAIWPCSPSVDIAIASLQKIASMRMVCAAANPAVNCTAYDIENPYLFHRGFEPWGSGTGDRYSYTTRPQAPNYKNLIERYPKLFDFNVLRITDDDLVISRQFTPNLNSKDFHQGAIWPLAWHQLRRTSAVNMFASGDLDDSSIQVLMKHRTIAQTVYYGRNFTRLHFNRDVGRITTAAKYESMAFKIGALHSERYVSPSGITRKTEIVHMMSARNFKTLVAKGVAGEVSFRATRLGGCASNTPCQYGGIESVSACAGSDKMKPCDMAIFDKMKKPSVERQLDTIERKLRIVDPKSPRGMALQMEAQGLRSFLNVVA